MNTVGFGKHDHAHCVTRAMQAAQNHCEQNRLRFTPVRRRVLEILLSEHRARGAYEILDVLSEESPGSQPPVAYRALDFLVTNGLAHRIERLNAYTACAHPGKHHAPAFLICRTCQLIAEVDGMPLNEALDAEAEAAGFSIERIAVELVGLCPACKDAAT